MRRGGVVVAIGAVLLLASCTSPVAGRTSPSPSPMRTGYGGVPLTGAAEPGSAPEPSRTPAGRVIALPSDSKPWGVAAAPDLDRVYVALRDPARLAAVDTTDDRVTTSAAPGTARMIDLASPDGPLLYPSESESRLVELDLPSLSTASSTATKRQPHQAVRVGDEDWVSEEYGHAVRVIRDGRTVAEFPQPVQPGGITATDGRVAAVDVSANLLFVFDVATKRLVAALPAGEGPSHVVPIGGGRVAVCDVRGNAVITYDVTGTPRRLGRAAVPGRAFWIDADADTGTIYTALSNANLVARLTVGADGAPHLSGTLPTVRQPISMDLADGRLWVAGYADAQLEEVPVTAFPES